MEDEKKKKRNKKKKNKQQAKAAAAASAEDTASNAGETSSQDQNHDSEQNHLSHDVGSTDGVPNNGSNNGAVSADGGKQNWWREEARLREMVKQLLYEKDSFMQTQADMEIKIKHLQREHESWKQKEVSLEQRISQLLQEKATLNFEESNLQEKVRHIEKERAVLVEKENSSKEIITALNNENKSLRLQVVELEGAKNDLSQENKQLKDQMSTLQSRIQDLESLPSAVSSADAQKDISEREDLNAQIEAACALVEKLVTENAELVEKINELYMELSRQSIPGNVTSAAVLPNNAAGPDPISGSSEDVSSSAKSTKLFGTVPIGEERVVSDDVDSDYADVARHSSETVVSGEIVQIPLDENEAQDLEAQASVDEGDETVPLVDAPLIGAPFRFVSFVAKYVSGADLVSKGSSDSLQ